MAALDAPPLSRAIASSRVLTARARRARLDLASATSAAYLAGLDRAQSALARRIEVALPGAEVRWRYGVVLNGLAVVVGRDQVQRLASLPGVAHVYPSLRYRALLDRSPGLIGAPALWGADLSTAGQGLKIGIIDDGLDQSHPFLRGAGFSMPPGFPKGQRTFTTAKVIAARAFPPPTPAWRHASKPFDPEFSEHATHVAGIAAGNNGFAASPARTLSGVAPRAYLGNYKVLTIPTVSGVGLDGNSAEIVAGIEAAVRDGMDVINLSLGEPEIEQSRDIVVAAIAGAADAGVVPVIAAGNDFDNFGRGSVGSPGSAPRAITAAAVTKRSEIASFSSSGPTPISQQLKPDVSAPGVGVLSSIPEDKGLFAEFNGTSMAAPHVAGAVALLLQRHPSWTVAQVKSALVTTGDPVVGDSGREVSTTREGGGLVDLAAANDPLLFAAPASLSFGVLRRGRGLTRAVSLEDAGAGGGLWEVSIAPQKADPGVVLTVPRTVSVPGSLAVSVRVSRTAAEKELTGFIVLKLFDQTRRIPYWLRVSVPTLAREAHRTLRRPGLYDGNTRGKASLVRNYRYPEAGGTFAGPEQVFRLTLTRLVANFGVAVTSHGPGVSVEPRVVFAGDEDHLTGYPALPLNLNPYVTGFLRRQLVVGAIRPAPGSYDVVFETRSARQAGPYGFRFWIDDTTPPRVRLHSRTLVAGAPLRLTVTDAGAGVDAASLLALVDGEPFQIEYEPKTGEVEIDLDSLGPGRHSLLFQVSDYQEAKNMENVAAILPNTRELRAVVAVQR